MEQTPMTASVIATGEAANWAPPVTHLNAPASPPGMPNLNVHGRRLMGPLQGFGQLRHKTYNIRLVGAQVSPAQVITVWRQRFASFWPDGNHFCTADSSIRAGSVAFMDLALPARMRLCTGVLVVYTDETSFCFMTPEGHMFGGLITFSAHDEDGTTIAQVQPLIRAGDPLYELTLRLGLGGRIEDEFWQQTLKNLAAHFGVQGSVRHRSTLIDADVQWSKAGNIWYNAAIRTLIHMLALPLHRVQRPTMH